MPYSKVLFNLIDIEMFICSNIVSISIVRIGTIQYGDERTLFVYFVRNTLNINKKLIVEKKVHVFFHHRRVINDPLKAIENIQFSSTNWLFPIEENFKYSFIPTIVFQNDVYQYFKRI